MVYYRTEGTEKNKTSGKEGIRIKRITKAPILNKEKK